MHFAKCKSNFETYSFCVLLLTQGIPPTGSSALGQPAARRKTESKNCINFLQSAKLNQNYQSKYSEADSAELTVLYNSSRKLKKAKSAAELNKKNKECINPRPKFEIDAIIKTMKEIRCQSMFECISGAMSKSVKLDVYIFREMKSFFRNQSHVEEDIQEFIKTIFTEYDDIYDCSMKEIVWTMKFLLSNPWVSMAEEIADLKSYLFDIKNENLGKYTWQFKIDHFNLYVNNLIVQLPDKARNYFKWKIEENECAEYIVPQILQNLPEDFLSPFNMHCS